MSGIAKNKEAFEWLRFSRQNRLHRAFREKHRKEKMGFMSKMI